MFIADKLPRRRLTPLAESIGTESGLRLTGSKIRPQRAGFSLRQRDLKPEHDLRARSMI
jgi:hypothetical protein